jgi:hypothetical protein
VCKPCPLGTYQPEAGQVLCNSCPLADKESFAIIDNQQRSRRSSSVTEGQIDVRSCVCAESFYRSKTAVCQHDDPSATCCSLCPANAECSGLRYLPCEEDHQDSEQCVVLSVNPTSAGGLNSSFLLAHANPNPLPGYWASLGTWTRWHPDLYYELECERMCVVYVCCACMSRCARCDDPLHPRGSLSRRKGVSMQSRL